MDDSRSARPRSRSDLPPSRGTTHLSPDAAAVEPSNQRAAEDTQENGARSPFGLPRRAATTAERDFRSPRRAATSSIQAEDTAVGGLRRRETGLSRRSALGRVPTSASKSRNTMLGQAGPEDTPALRAAHENYVNPEYTALNPAYQLPASSTPVWSLAKPLPRVVRPGMIPTKSELEVQQQNAPRPAENTQKAGIDVDPTDLEEGRVQPTLNPAKLSAQLKDSRAQREQNYVQSVAQRRGTIVSHPQLATRPTRASSTASQARRARATSQVSQAPMTSVGEEVSQDINENLAGDGEQATNRLEPQQSPASGDGSRRSQEQARPSEQLEPIPEYHEPPTRRGSMESEETLHLEEEPDLYADMNELKLVAENPPLYDEIHNNHTTWSVVRTHNREFLAELLGVFVQLSVGFCADISATLNGDNANVNTTAWAWGFSTMVAIYISGGISGAHLNPVITIMLWFYRGFPKRKMLPYFIAQFLGAIMAGFTAYGLYYASIRHYELTNPSMNILNGFVPSQRLDYIGPATAFFNEFFGVLILACAVLALGDDQNAPPGAGMNALIVGLLITLLNFCFAYQTGAALNPARDFGPRLAMLALGYGSHLFTNPFWFYGPWAGALCGAMIGASLYDICIFTGGESPINYPWTRTKRSWKKGKAKWGRRVSKLKIRRKGSMQKGEADLEMAQPRVV